MFFFSLESGAGGAVETLIGRTFTGFSTGFLLVFVFKSRFVLWDAIGAVLPSWAEFLNEILRGSPQRLGVFEIYDCDVSVVDAPFFLFSLMFRFLFVSRFFYGAPMAISAGATGKK